MLIRLILILLCRGLESTDVNLSICSRYSHIQDVRGVAKGSICTVAKRMDYEKANDLCAVNGMKLFNLSDKNTEETLFNFFEDFYGEENFFWVEKEPISDNLCSVITSLNKTVQTRKLKSSDKFWFHCHTRETIVQSYDFQHCASKVEIILDKVFQQCV